MCLLFRFSFDFCHFCFFLLAKNMNQTKPAARSADVHAGKAEGPRVHKRAANAEVRSAPRTVLLPQRVAARLTLATRPRGTYSGQARLRQRYRHGVWAAGKALRGRRASGLADCSRSAHVRLQPLG
jgi:hypothetical protein